MPTIRHYFETDFPYCVRLDCHFEIADSKIEARMMCDFAGFSTYFALYVSGTRSLSFYRQILQHLQYGKTTIFSDHNIQLPYGWELPAEIRIKNDNELAIDVRYHGDPRWISWKQLPASRRVFIYSETDFPEHKILQLELDAMSLGHDVQFRSPRHAMMRSEFETPVAFISHDSRDAEIARKIALGMQKHRCSVWYDEFSLRAGDNLRDSIEKGLKQCHKCVIVLSTNFFSNGGWTKREFDSIFTREILEETNLVLPVWYSVGKKEVYDYSPSLLNVKGVDWEHLGEDEVIRQLSFAILAPGREWRTPPRKD
jgi:TIR domain